MKIELCNFLSENEILREGNISLEILRNKLRTRVSDLEEELRRLRDELENKQTKSADDEVIETFFVLDCFIRIICTSFSCSSIYCCFRMEFVETAI